MAKKRFILKYVKREQKRFDSLEFANLDKKQRKGLEKDRKALDKIKGLVAKYEALKEANRSLEEENERLRREVRELREAFMRNSDVDDCK